MNRIVLAVLTLFAAACGASSNGASTQAVRVKSGLSSSSERKLFVTTAVEHPDGTVLSRCIASGFIVDCPIISIE